MTLLLDTHALVWAVTAPERLSSAARDRISSPSEPVLVSAVSAWELSTKHRSGKWPEVAPLLHRYDALLAELRFTALPLEHDHALTAGTLDWVHRDPFDRALAAQAIREGVALVTKDRVFAELPGLSVVW